MLQLNILERINEVFLDKPNFVFNLFLSFFLFIFLLMEGKTTLLVYLCLVEEIVLHYIILLLLGEATLGHTSKGKSKTKSYFKYI